MIGLDTNILIRYLTQDDRAQSAKATQILEHRLTQNNPGFVSVEGGPDFRGAMVQFGDAAPLFLITPEEWRYVNYRQALAHVLSVPHLAASVLASAAKRTA